MRQVFKGLPLIVLIACAGPGFAQTTTPTETAPATQAETAPAPATDPLAPNLGEEVAPVPGPGSTYTREVFSDWDLRCVTVAEGKEPCQLYQLLKDKEGNPVAEVALFGLPEGSEAVAGATIITPLETLLTQQLTLSVDAGAGKRYPFSWCSTVGCFSRIGLTATDIADFKKGNAINMVIVPVAAPDQKVELAISLKGFTAGYDAVLATAAE